MNIIKVGGRDVEYDPSKVRGSILRTGASEQIADKILSEIEPSLYDGMTTKELYGLVHERLKNQNVCYACRYNLREGILRLGPAGFKFEKYVASILNAYNWHAKVPEEDLQGSCVAHEVDVIAEKDGRRVVIEAKFRNRYQDYVNLKDTMATWSRFLDLVDGAAVGRCPHFDEVWIVTNARFSDRARQFGVCKGIHMIGWDFPAEKPFNKMVDHLALYPVTVIDGLQKSELEAFAEQGLMLCIEIAQKDEEEIARRTGISETRAQEIVNLCSAVVASENEQEKHGHK